ncbi:MAG: CDP-alcohol phosphatidyltransferase [Verrucomicrobiales bacterium]|nr:CDP-alcohol phosphatidyltransferase [Verrucomicrobiales bacterium]
MANEADKPAAKPELKIYFLPNLLTAGNLFCGFLALTKIVEANVGEPSYNHTIGLAIFFILLACIFDLFDGRVARMGGVESPFGREFDSLADVVSFGVAPAFLVHRIVLRDLNPPELGWFISSVYLICGALRLARFNCLSAMGISSGKEFKGFPIPAAAGMVASLTMFLLWCDEKAFTTSNAWRFVLPAIMIFLSIMMVSEVKYPSFKSVDFRSKRRFPTMVAMVVFIGLIIVAWKSVLPWLLPLGFTAYLIYGFVRPSISREMRREIEEEEEDETPVM